MHRVERSWSLILPPDAIVDGMNARDSRVRNAVGGLKDTVRGK
jgi:hypothetical protein